MTLIMEYLHTQKLSKDKNEVMKLRRRSCSYYILDENMYKKGFSSPLIKCTHEEEAEAILKENHQGESGGHSGFRVLTHKVLRQGLYWPTIHQDA